MTLIEILSAQWANPEHTVITGTALVNGVNGEWPYAVFDGYDTPLGQEIWDAAIQGGNIPEHEPEPEPIPDEISRRQFFQQLAVLGIITKAEALAALQGGAIPAPLQAIIDQLPTEDAKFEAQMLVIGATAFNRLHPLSEIVRQAMQWTVEQKDDFWRDAANL